jgi:hypothetical protein
LANGHPLHHMEYAWLHLFHNIQTTLLWHRSLHSGNDMTPRGVVTWNVPRAFTRIRPSSLHHSYTCIKKSPGTRSLGVPFLTKIHGVSFSTLKSLTTKIYLHLTHGLDLTRGGDPTPKKSHDATWNYPGTPHHHGVRGPIQLEMDTSTRGFWRFNASAFNTFSYILKYPEVPKSRSSKLLK